MTRARANCLPDCIVHDRTDVPGRCARWPGSAAKAKVNATNSKYGAQWVTSYANSGKTKTYCVYNAADEAAVRAAAKANGIPVDKVTEVPVAAAAK